MPAPLAGGQLPWGPPDAPDAVLVHQPPHRPTVGAELGGTSARSPSPHQQPISQAHPQVGEAELGGPRGEPPVGGVAALAGQPLSTWEQPDPDLAQRPFDGPLINGLRQ